MSNSWFGWIVIAFLTIWLFALIAFTCMSLLVRCVNCNEDGNLVLRKAGRRFRRNLGERSLVTKEVKDHAFLDDEICSKTEEAGDIESVREDDYSDEGLQKCAICLEPYRVGEMVSWAKYLTNCPHAFHPECIKPWITKHSGCPCCRSQIIDRNDLVVEICCGNKGGDKKSSRIQLRDMIDESRQKGEFCIIHGLVFPPPVQLEQDTEIKEKDEVPLATDITSGHSGFMLAPRSRLSPIDDEFELDEERSLSTHVRANCACLDTGEDSPPPLPVGRNRGNFERGIGMLGTNFLNFPIPPSPGRKLYYGPYYVGPLEEEAISTPKRNGRKALKIPDDAEDTKDCQDKMDSPRGVVGALLE